MAKRARSGEESDPLLHVHRDTLRCAVGRCVPCSYKVLLDGGPHAVRNQRPEMCTRLRSAEPSAEADAAGAGAGGLGGLYGGEARILTVGDGNFSFSLSLARGGAASRLVASSHESQEVVLATYPDGAEVLGALSGLGVEVLHGVDATALGPELGQFDRIVWNFPCVRDESGADGQTSEMEENLELLRRFFRTAPARLAPGGQLHVTHKTKPPFCYWGLEQLAEAEGLACVQRVVFDRTLYPGYHNKKVLTRGTFPCWDARTYVFSPAGAAGAAAAEAKEAKEAKEEGVAATIVGNLAGAWDWSDAVWDMAPELLPLPQAVLNRVQEKLRKKEHERLPPLPAAAGPARGGPAKKEAVQQRGSMFAALADSASESDSDSD